MSSTSRRYSPEVRERAVRMVFEHQHEHESQWAAIVSVAAKIGCTRGDAADLGAPSRGRRGPPAWGDVGRAGAAEGARA